MSQLNPIIFLIISLIIMNLCTTTVHGVEKVNCRRVVFHPYCRGISAKRSLQLTEPSEDNGTGNLDNVKHLLPKLWQGLPVLDIKNRILEQFKRQQEPSLFKPMTAIMIGDEITNKITGEDPHNTRSDESSTLSSSIDMDKFTFDILTSNNQRKQAHQSIDDIIKRHSTMPKEKRQQQQQKHVFLAKMVPYPQFRQIFDPLLRKST